MKNRSQRKRFVYYVLAIVGGILMLAAIVLSVVFVIHAQMEPSYDMPGLGAFVEIGFYSLPLFIVGIIMFTIGMTKLRNLRLLL